jgi:hypothetical protein
LSEPCESRLFLDWSGLLLSSRKCNITYISPFLLLLFHGLEGGVLEPKGEKKSNIRERKRTDEMRSLQIYQSTSSGKEKL